MSILISGPLIGGLTPTSANLWARADGPGILYAWLGTQPDLSDAVLAGRSLPLRPEDGFAGVAPVSGLSPDTHYHYALTLSDLPPDPALGPYPEFTAFPPDGEPRSFTFAFGSCFRPTDAGGGEIFERLEEHRLQDRLRFWLLLGDQIYADAYAYNSLGKIAVSLAEYRECYRYAWARPPLQQLLANLPAFMTLDDHEVDDDWRWINRQRTQATFPWWDRLDRWLKRRPIEERSLPRQRVLDALQAYWEHQGMHAPPFSAAPALNPSGQYDLDATRSGALAYTFNYGAAAFFVLDTRTQRICNRGERGMLGEEQWQALEGWLLRVKDAYPLKFIVSSGAVLHRFFFDIPADRWSGFPRERDRLLGLLAAQDIHGVFVLTGDLHVAHALQAELSGSNGQALPVWEFCSSPFDQQPDRLSRLFYNPLPFGPVKRLKLVFTAGANNYGLVRVIFPPRGRPHVEFEVYGEDGSLLGRASA